MAVDFPHKTIFMSAESDEQLLATARVALENSYAPYSKYRVGAALLAKDGRVFSGCNMEVCTWEGSICAERVALAGAVAAGCREFEAIAIVCERTPEIWPCGICRQCLAEFGIDWHVVVPQPDGKPKKLRLAELLPYYFPVSELGHRVQS